ncbi:MAG: hypothetical protein GTO12_13915 [Proteobacteria bacterium]|nr:hypothetical protein [Pseudomonadota bacterium]
MKKIFTYLSYPFHLWDKSWKMKHGFIPRGKRGSKKGKQTTDFAKGILGNSIIQLKEAAMSVTTDLEQSWEEKKQREAIFSARATLEDMTNTANEGLSRLQVIKDLGQFDTIPADLQAALNRWWQMYKDLQTAFNADQELTDIYQWRP